MPLALRVGQVTSLVLVGREAQAALVLPNVVADDVGVLRFRIIRIQCSQWPNGQGYRAEAARGAGGGIVRLYRARYCTVLAERVSSSSTDLRKIDRLEREAPEALLARDFRLLAGHESGARLCSIVSRHLATVYPL